jgi:hypothetical protein
LNREQNDKMAKMMQEILGGLLYKEKVGWVAMKLLTAATSLST